VLLSIRILFKGLYRRCQCGCGYLIKCLNKKYQFIRFKKGHNIIGKYSYSYKGGFSIHKRKDSNNFYKYVKKRYYKYSRKDGYIQEHRYIMYIYLSILNNKITYIEGFDVHHINEDSLDNRPENLQLVTKSQHKTIHGIGNQYALKDKSNILCNLCGGKTAIRPKKGKHKTDREDWFTDIDGYLCRSCCLKIRYYRKKFGLK
jgi:hypothetical protein